MLTEHNVVIKDPRKVDIRFASSYPNLYKAAMSSLGFHVIYDFLNSREDVYCERIVYPYYRSLESNSPLSDFDILSFSIQYEKDYFNVLDMLHNAKVPIRKDDRTHKDPLVIAGGPCASANPLPMSKFIDLFIVGEAEVILDEVLDTYMELDDPRSDIDAFLDIKGVYIPDHPAERAIVDDMCNANHPIRQVVPKTDDKRFIPAFEDAFLLGISRGCTRGCRFCMTGYIYRPRREMPLGKLFEIAERGRHATGLDKIALIGAATSDYSKMDDLCDGLFDRGFRIITPSLRIESISGKLLDILQKSGLKTITIAPESTQRVRTVLNKLITDDDTIRVVKMALERRMNVKLYFLVGSPTETMADIQDMVEFIKKLNRMADRKNAVRISVNPLIPKPHTPFQWEGFDFDDLKTKIDYLNLKLKSIPLKVESLKSSLIQYVLSTGDAKLGDIIEKAWRRRVSLKEWESAALKESLDGELPWENINVGLKPDFLKKEYEKALEGETTPWCEKFGCYHCGVCE